MSGLAHSENQPRWASPLTIVILGGLAHVVNKGWARPTYVGSNLEVSLVVIKTESEKVFQLSQNRVTEQIVKKGDE
jgi:hypothetical protein